MLCGQALAACLADRTSGALLPDWREALRVCRDPVTQVCGEALTMEGQRSCCVK